MQKLKQNLFAASGIGHNSVYWTWFDISYTHLIDNCVVAVVIAHWEKDIDHAHVQHILNLSVSANDASVADVLI